VFSNNKILNKQNLKTNKYWINPLKEDVPKKAEKIEGDVIGNRLIKIK